MRWSLYPILVPILVLTLLPIDGGSFAASAETTPRCAYSSIDAFDPDLDAETRLAAVERLQQAAANPGCSNAHYLLGMLYRHGPDLPGNLLSREPSRARELIWRAARSGRLMGYAALAELALEEGEPQEAMRWTQGYLREVRRQGGTDAFDMQGYNAHLLLRAVKALRKAGLSARTEALDAALREYLEQERRARAEDLAARQESAGGSETENGPDGTEIELRVKRRPEDGTEIAMQSAGHAEYLLEVQPDGRVSRIVVQSFMPTWEHAVRLRPLVAGFEFHPHGGDEAEVARVPVTLGFQDSRGVRLKHR